MSAAAGLRSAVQVTLASDLSAASAQLPAPLELRAAGPGDREALDAFVAEHAHPLGLQQLACGKWEPHRRGPRPTEILIEESGRPVGVGWTEVAEIMGADPFGDEHTVLAIVAPDRRRRGLGTAIVQLLEREAARRGARRLVSAAADDDAAGMGFLEARGYRPFSRRAFWSIDLERFDERRFSPATELADRAGVRLLSYREAAAALGPELEEGVREAHLRALVDMLPLGGALSIAPDLYARLYLDEDRLDADASTIALHQRTVVGVALAHRGGGEAALPIVTADGRARAWRVPLALKLRTLGCLRRAGVRRASLVNDPDNAPSRRVLRSLGFVQGPVLVRADRRVRGAGGITTV